MDTYPVLHKAAYMVLYGLIVPHYLSRCTTGSLQVIGFITKLLSLLDAFSLNKIFYQLYQCLIAWYVCLTTYTYRHLQTQPVYITANAYYITPHARSIKIRYMTKQGTEEH